MKNKRTYIKYGVLVIMAIIIISITPLMIDYLIIGNDFPSNIDNDEWVSFLGSYIGAVIGSIATLIGIIITLNFTTKQTKEEREFILKQTYEERRLSIVPYFKYTMYENPLFTKESHDIDIFQVIDKDSNTTVDATIKLKNIGNGPAIDIKVYNVSYEGKNRNLVVNRGDGALESKSELFISIDLRMRLDEISNDMLIKNHRGALLEYGPPIGYKNKSGILSISIRYEDLIGNIYEQNIELLLNIKVKSEYNGLDRKYVRPKLNIVKIEESKLL